MQAQDSHPGALLLFIPTYPLASRMMQSRMKMHCRVDLINFQIFSRKIFYCIHATESQFNKLLSKVQGQWGKCIDAMLTKKAIPLQRKSDGLRV